MHNWGHLSQYSWVSPCHSLKFYYSNLASQWPNDIPFVLLGNPGRQAVYHRWYRSYGLRVLQSSLFGFKVFGDKKLCRRIWFLFAVGNKAIDLEAWRRQDQPFEVCLDWILRLIMDQPAWSSLILGESNHWKGFIEIQQSSSLNGGNSSLRVTRRELKFTQWTALLRLSMITIYRALISTCR